MRFVDTHCHFDFLPFAGNEEGSLTAAVTAGVEKLIVPATVAENFDRIMMLAYRHMPLYAALGLHPIFTEKHQRQHLHQLEAWLKQQPAKLVAVGEIGLDCWHDSPEINRQEQLLEAQLWLAKAYNYPVILHSRRAHDKLVPHLKRAALPRCGVIHGFAGSLQQAQAFIRLGYYIGVGGTITWTRAAKTRRTIANLPLDMLLLETDAPDMPLSGFQGQPNRPERTRLVWQTLCQLRSESACEIAHAMWINSHRLFTL